ncbi:MAG: hypothetical protein H6Q69_1728, partial [Firmicutes bacterium]|nr:hypothetical protein [Bacillota bacterium]
KDENVPPRLTATAQILRDIATSIIVFSGGLLHTNAAARSCYYTKRDQKMMNYIVNKLFQFLNPFFSSQ